MNWRETLSIFCNSHTEIAKGMGSSTRVSNRGGGPARVPILRVRKHLGGEVAQAGEEGRINVLSWYPPVGVAKDLQLEALSRVRTARY